MIEVDQAFSVHRAKGKDFIKVKNYVGVIEIKGGTTIEILPKIYLSDGEDQEQTTRRLFLKMLRHLRDSPFRVIDQAHLKTSRFPILEIFITSFLTELGTLIKGANSAVHAMARMANSKSEDQSQEEGDIKPEDRPGLPSGA